MTGKRCLDLDPPERFMLQFHTEDGDWIEEAVYLAADATASRTAATAVGTDGTGTMIRYIEKHRDHIVHIDGTDRCFESNGRILLPEGGELSPKVFDGSGA